MPNPCTLREALDAVGKTRFPDTWIGKEADLRQPPGPDATEEERDSYPADWQGAWKRRQKAVDGLRGFIRHESVKAWLLFRDGTRREIQGAEWEALNGPLWLNYSASLGGHLGADGVNTGDAGEVWIDRGQLDGCLSKPGAKPKKSSDVRERRKQETAKTDAECYNEVIKFQGLHRCSIRKAAKEAARDLPFKAGTVERKYRSHKKTLRQGG